MFKLYFRGRLISQHADFDEAEAGARWAFYEFQSYPWDGEKIPPGYMIAVDGGGQV